MDLSNFHIELANAPGLGKSYTFTVMKNGSPTALEVVIADTATAGTDAGHVDSFIPGDTVSLRATPSGTPGGTGNHYWNFQVSTGGGVAPLLTGLSSPSTSLVSYGSMLAGHNAAAGWSSTESDLQVVIPSSGTLSNLYTNLSTAPGNSKTYTFTVMKNGSATTLENVLTGAAILSGSDTIHTVAVAAGDTLTIRSTPTSSPAGTTPAFGLTFTPNNTGENFMGFGSANAPSATVANYEQMLGIGNQAWAASESGRYMMPGPCTLRGLSVKLITAPGVGNSRTFTIRKSTGDTALSVTISGASTTGSISGNVECAQGEFVMLKSAISGTPAAATGGVHAGLLLYNDPKSPIVIIY
jgi:hypothetical protein